MLSEGKNPREPLKVLVDFLCQAFLRGQFLKSAFLEAQPAISIRKPHGGEYNCTHDYCNNNVHYNYCYY